MRTTTGTNKIKKFEGLRLKAYVCAAGSMYDRLRSHDRRKPVMLSPRPKADAFFESDIRAVENR